MPTSSGGVFAHLYVWAIGAKKATPADIVACLKANPEACAEVLAACGHTTVEMVIDQRTQAERERDEARVRCESLACSLDEAVRGGKYYVKARVYGAIACEFRKTLQAFADRGEALAKAALEWRYSERNGVPVSAIETTGELLDAMTENGALKAKLAEAESTIASLRAIEAMHEAALSRLVDPITGAGYFMVIGKEDEPGADEGWYVTFGGPYDSYTLSERDDEDGAGGVTFSRERFDHDEGRWVEGCETVEGTLFDDAQMCEADEKLTAAESRASAAEAKLAALSALIHTESGLDDHRYSAEQMVKEMAERWQGASDDCEKAEQALATVTGERDEARAERDAAVDRLVGARVARESAIEDAEALRARLAKTERVVGAARKAEKAAECRAKGCTCCANVVQSDVTAALRALDAPDDSPVGAGTDSGGSGAATPEGGHAAPTGGPMPPPEPAGGCRCGAGCKPAPRYDGDEDSPVGVAATAMGGHVEHHKPAESPSNPEKQGAPSITRADLSALEERIVERVCEALEHVAETVSPAHWSAGMTRLADELRRKP